MDRPVIVTIAATRSAVKFSLAIRGSVDVGRTVGTANDPFGGGPDMPRKVIPGVVGSCAIVSAKVSGIPLLFASIAFSLAFAARRTSAAVDELR
jgi:hypothetical protein